MAAAKAGDRVKVEYKGTFDDGSAFDSSEGRGPMEITLGGGEVIPGFEEAITGMAPGEKKTVTIEPDKGYGTRDEAMVHEVPRDTLPEGIELAEGLVLEAQQQDGQVFALTIVAFNDDQVTLDANHPLAGRDLNFEIELVEIV